MPTSLEYAQLAGRVYERTPRNRTPIPAGWTELSWIPNGRISGFSAGVHRNGNEIVISYIGTNEVQVLDFIAGNIPIKIGLSSVQVTEAMLLYLETKQQYPNTQITFTGHSLGAGLASLMAVFFDLPAVTFDSAPFEQSAFGSTLLNLYAVAFSAFGINDSKWRTYVNTAAAGSVATLFAQREGNVAHQSLQFNRAAANDGQWLLRLGA